MNSCRYSLHKSLRKMSKYGNFKNKLRNTPCSDLWDLKTHIAMREREARLVLPQKLSSQGQKNSSERGREKFKNWKMKMFRLILRTTVKKNKRRKLNSFKPRLASSSRSHKKWKMILRKRMKRMSCWQKSCLSNKNSWTTRVNVSKSKHRKNFRFKLKS